MIDLMGEAADKLHAAIAGARGKKSKNSKETLGFSSMLSNARSVLHHSPALAQDVLADRVPLDTAASHRQALGALVKAGAEKWWPIIKESAIRGQ
jgi:hypothetical protein